MLPDLSSLDADVRRRLKLLLEQQSTVCAGQLVIVGLDAIREKLGSGWDRYCDRVHSHFDKVVEGTLAPSEVTLRLSDDKYVVVFHDRDQAASQVVCEKILSEVHNTFLGSPDLGGLTLEAVVMTLDPESFARSMGVELDSSARSAGVSEKKSAPMAKAAPARVRHKAGRFDVSAQDVWYLPCWDLENQMIYSFRPTIVRTLGRRRVAGYAALEDPRDPKQIRALDLLLVERGLNDLKSLGKTEEKLLMVLPVNYVSLEHTETRARLHRLCTAVPAGVRKRVIFLLTGLTPGRPPWRVHEYATVLGQLGRVVFARIDARWDNLGPLGDLPIRGLIVDVESDFRPPQRIARDLARIRAFCQTNRLAMGVGGVYSLDLARAARELGAKFINGHYILGAVDKPQSSLSFDWMDISGVMGDTAFTPGAAKAG